MLVSVLFLSAYKGVALAVAGSGSPALERIAAPPRPPSFLGRFVCLAPAVLAAVRSTFRPFWSQAMSSGPWALVEGEPCSACDPEGLATQRGSRPRVEVNTIRAGRRSDPPAGSADRPSSEAERVVSLPSHGPGLGAGSRRRCFEAEEFGSDRGDSQARLSPSRARPGDGHGTPPSGDSGPSKVRRNRLPHLRGRAGRRAAHGRPISEPA